MENPSPAAPAADVELQAQPASITATISIKRAATGLTEHHQVKFVPATTPNDTKES